MPYQDPKEAFMNSQLAKEFSSSCSVRDSGAVLTDGQKLVGLDFNPSNNNTVYQLKCAFAQAIDILKNSMEVSPGDVAQQLQTEAIMRAVDAQMWAVKAFTFKY